MEPHHLCCAVNVAWRSRFRGTRDNSIRIASGGLLLLGLLAGCSSAGPPTGSADAAALPETGSADATALPETGSADAAALPETGSADAASRPPIQPDAAVTCGSTSCAASQSYCEVGIGGAGGRSGSGQPTVAPTTYRCVPFPSTCPSPSCNCAVGCSQCTQDATGAVTVMCLRA